MEPTIKVLIVDDSVIYRSQIRAALASIARIEVVGAASNGKLAIDRLSQGSVDLLILDLEMPEMDGIQTLNEMKRLGYMCKVLVFSSASKRGADITMEALRLCASDFVAKPYAVNPDMLPHEVIKSLLEPKLNALFPESESRKTKSVEGTRKYPNIIWDLLSPQIVVIGSSTGGPTVLEKLFSQISGPLSCPIIIAQHMPPIFTASLAERISTISGITAKEAVQGEVLKNEIYIAPGDFHLRLTGTKERTVMNLDQGPKINSVRPAVDPLFSSAAEIFKEKCLGFVLTGMGADGKVGAESIKHLGGAVVIQSESTCVVFGMPGAVFVSGTYDKIMSPDEIVGLLTQKIASLKTQRSVVGG